MYPLFNFPLGWVVIVMVNLFAFYLSMSCFMDLKTVGVDEFFYSVIIEKIYSIGGFGIMFLELVIPIGLLTQFSAPKLLLIKKMCQLGRTFLLEMLVTNEHCSAYMPAWYGAFCRESPSHPRGHKRCLSSGKTNGSKSLLWTD